MNQIDLVKGLLQSECSVDGRKEEETLSASVNY